MEAIEGEIARRDEAIHVGQGVDAGVGSATARQVHGVPERPLKGLFQRALYSAQSGLPLPAVEIRPVKCHPKGQFSRHASDRKPPDRLRKMVIELTPLNWYDYFLAAKPADRKIRAVTPRTLTQAKFNWEENP